MTADQEFLLNWSNSSRAENGGLPALAWNDNLEVSATHYAMLLATQAPFGHFLNSTTPGSRAQAVGYPNAFVGENIARGWGTAEATATAWRNSPDHWANLLTAAYGCCGIGIANGPFGYSAVCDFGVGNPGGGPIPPPPPPPPLPVPVPVSFYELELSNGIYTFAPSAGGLYQLVKLLDGSLTFQVVHPVS